MASNVLARTKPIQPTPIRVQRRDLAWAASTGYWPHSKPLSTALRKASRVTRRKVRQLREVISSLPLPWTSSHNYCPIRPTDISTSFAFHLVPALVSPLVIHRLYHSFFLSYCLLDVLLLHTFVDFSNHNGNTFLAQTHALSTRLVARRGQVGALLPVGAVQS